HCFHSTVVGFPFLSRNMSENTVTPGGPAGRRLLPVAIDDLAREDPNKVWALLPNPSKEHKGYQKITYSILANAINCMAWFIEERLGKSLPNQFPTVCYIGKADMRYQI